MQRIVTTIARVAGPVGSKLPKLELRENEKGGGRPAGRVCVEYDFEKDYRPNEKTTGTQLSILLKAVKTRIFFNAFHCGSLLQRDAKTKCREQTGDHKTAQD